MNLPYIYEIEPTNHCPYKCIMCPRGLGKMKRPKGFIQLNTVKLILDQLIDNQKLVRLHHFGEAVLHPDLDKIIYMVKEKGIKSVISLNPASLNKTTIKKLLMAPIDMVCFSLDSFSDNGLYNIRGITKPFHECWDMVELFINQSRDLDRSILKVIQMVRLDLNREDLDQFRKIKDKFPENDVELYIAENTGFGDLDLIEATYKGGSRYVLKGAKPCQAPFNEVVILYNGDVVLCCYDYDGFNVIGNIHQKTVSEIWHDEKVTNLRKIFQKKKTHNLPLCSKCFLAPHNFNKAASFYSRGLSEEKVLLDLLERAI